jgi:hypothetical protein
MNNKSRSHILLLRYFLHPSALTFPCSDTSYILLLSFSCSDTSYILLLSYSPAQILLTSFCSHILLLRYFLHPSALIFFCSDTSYILLLSYSPAQILLTSFCSHILLLRYFLHPSALLIILTTIIKSQSFKSYHQIITSLSSAS